MHVFFRTFNFSIVFKLFICLSTKCSHGQGEGAIKVKGGKGREGLKTGKNAWRSFMAGPLTFCGASMFLKLSDFYSKMILKLFFGVKDVALPENQRNIFEFLLTSYFIRKQCKSGIQ